MSVASEITRIKNAKTAIKNAINSKGGSITNEKIEDYAQAILDLPTGGGGLTGGYNVVYRSNFYSQFPDWISITLTFVDDTTASYVIATNGNVPSDWEHYTGIENIGEMIFTNAGPYVWNNVKSVSITANALGGSPYLEINGVNVGATYNATLDKNILVHQTGGNWVW
jgi:hypothetical protein